MQLACIKIISSVNTNQKKDWDQLHQYAAKMYQELLQKIR